MAPREDLSLLEDAQHRIMDASIAVKAGASHAPLLTSDARSQALEGILVAREDLEWNVYPTDTGEVFERVLAFAENVRQFLQKIGANVKDSQFKDTSAIKSAHEAVAVISRHLRLTRLYDAAEAQRLSRSTSDQDEDLDILEKKGKEAIKALSQMLDDAEAYITNVL